jgi:hypothetical protein
MSPVSRAAKAEPSAASAYAPRASCVRRNWAVLFPVSGTACCVTNSRASFSTISALVLLSSDTAATAPNGTPSNSTRDAKTHNIGAIFVRGFNGDRILPMMSGDAAVRNVCFPPKADTQGAGVGQHKKRAFSVESSFRAPRSREVAAAVQVPPPRRSPTAETPPSSPHSCYAAATKRPLRRVRCHLSRRKPPQGQPALSAARLVWALDR